MVCADTNKGEIWGEMTMSQVTAMTKLYFEPK